MADDFASGLAAHARAVVGRYPWVEDWTPVNEPLTTARFSCLYGHWYPHMRDEDACWLALFNQIDAIRAAMREIRLINPAARLIQTEDLGFCHAIPELAAEAAFENDRRWLSWDLLCGHVLPDHPLWKRLAGRGFEDRLRVIADDPCPPDVIGINHYLTSERFLDDQITRYPGVGPSAESGERFVNVEAVRTAPGALLGIETLLEQTWHRYGRGMAITECHNGCTREEQMRWFLQTWRAAERARLRGMKVEAVTAWSLLGAFDWDRLVTVDAGHYECGVYDLRSGAPRPTAMVPLLRALASGAELPHPELLEMPGWWEREVRFWPGLSSALASSNSAVKLPPVGCPSRGPAADSAPNLILITGKSGTLGQMFARRCGLRGLPHLLTDRQMLAIDDPSSVAEALDHFRPAAVVNTAGLVDIERAEADPAACFAANTGGAVNLARACRDRGISFVAFSTDQVFDGTKGTPYVEGDGPNPLNSYGLSKAEAERHVLDIDAEALVIRTAAFYSAHDVYNFAVHALEAVCAGGHFMAAADNFVSPTYIPDLADATLDLLLDGESGIRHLASGGGLSWAAFARALAIAAGLDPDLVKPVEAETFGWAALRPANAMLGSEHGEILPSLDDAIHRFMTDYQPAAGHAMLG